MFSAGANISQQLDLSKFYESTRCRQLLFFPLSVVVMYTSARFNYRRLAAAENWLKSPSLYLLIAAIVLLTIVLIPGIGAEINQARRWLRIPAGPASISFQPSEFAKYVLILFIASYCARYSNSIHLYWKRFIPLCIVAGIIAGLIIVEDLGTAALVAVLAVLMMFAAGIKFLHLLTPLPFAIAGFVVMLLHSPGRLNRIAAFLNPQKWSDSTAYQANQSLLALGSGGLLGKGLGRGICKYGHLPEDTTDFIFAIIGEELGLVGTVAVISLFVAFVWLGMLVVIRCGDQFGRLLAFGITVTIGLQAAINIGVVTVLLPTKGLPLPFVSAGGTSMLLSAVGVGLLVNIARQLPGIGVLIRDEF